MKVALIQQNPTVGALEDNAARLLDAARAAARAGANLAVASELVLLGYPPRDLLDRPGFVKDALAVTDKVVRDAPADVTLIFGTIGQANINAHSPITNDAVVVTGGRLLGRAQKQLLPSYDVFDETRHFRAGTETAIVTAGQQRIALSICEDAWAADPSLQPRYAKNPLDAVTADRADLLVNVSASPFTLRKLSFRPLLFGSIAKRLGIPVVLVNQVGGNDELIFDGRSSIWDASGNIVTRAKAFAEDFVISELSGGHLEPEPIAQAHAAYEALVLGVRDYTRKCGFERAVVGLSGGIDSAVTATLAADALGPENVLGVAMPTRYSSEGSLSDARALAMNLGIDYRKVDIDPLFDAYLQNLGPFLDSLRAAPPSDVTLENLQARIRGATLMAISNRSGAIVLTTGNKSEIAVGYCTLYGDMVGGLAVISDVPKTMVYSVARFINRERERIPVSSIEKPPSAELRPDQKDEDSLPPYDVLDAILELLVEEHRTPTQIIEMGFDTNTVERTLQMVLKSEYKRRQAAPGLIITSKAFGPGRRMPVAQGYKTA